MSRVRVGGGRGGREERPVVVSQRDDAVQKPAAAHSEPPLHRLEGQGGRVVVRSQRGAAGGTVSVQGRRRLASQRPTGSSRLAPGGLGEGEGLGGSGLGHGRRRGVVQHRQVLLQ